MKKFFRTGSKAGIQAAHAPKLRTLLTALNQAECALDMNAPNWELHSLHGDLEGHWSVKVNANWRVTFKFEGQDAEVVDYLDYH